MASPDESAWRHSCEGDAMLARVSWKPHWLSRDAVASGSEVVVLASCGPVMERRRRVAREPEPRPPFDGRQTEP